MSSRKKQLFLTNGSQVALAIVSASVAGGACIACPSVRACWSDDSSPTIGLRTVESRCFRPSA